MGDSAKAAGLSYHCLKDALPWQRTAPEPKSPPSGFAQTISRLLARSIPIAVKYLCVTSQIIRKIIFLRNTISDTVNKDGII